MDRANGVVRLIGFVGYEDEPETFFRWVRPDYDYGESDSVLDDPQWITLGVDPTRKARLVKFIEGSKDAADAARRMTGIP